MDGKSKFVIIFSVLWMIVAAGMFLAVILKWMDRESFKIYFAVGFILFSLIVSAMTLMRKKN